VVEVLAGSAEAYGHELAVSLPVGGAVDAAIDGFHAATASTSDASAVVDTELPSDAEWGYPTGIVTVSFFTTLQLIFPVAVQYSGSGVLSMGGIAVPATNIVAVDEFQVFAYSADQLPTGNVCVRATAGMFVSVATGEAMTISELCLEVEGYTPTTPTSTVSSLSSASSGTSLSSTASSKSTASSSTSTSVSSTSTTASTATTTSTTTSTTTTDVPMCDSSVIGTLRGSPDVATNCNGQVLVGTVCRAVGCPAGSVSWGSAQCFPSEHMVGITYCLAADMNTSTIFTVVAELRLTLSLTEEVSTETLASAIRPALMAALGITDPEDLLQFGVQVTEVLRAVEVPDFVLPTGNRRLQRRHDMEGEADTPGLRPGRRLTAIVVPTEEAVDMTAAVFYEIRKSSQEEADNLATLASDVAEPETEASDAFFAGLAVVGTSNAARHSVRAIENPVVTEQVVATNADGRIIFFDSDGNGVVDNLDAVSTTSTSTTLSTRSTGSSTSSSTSTSVEPPIVIEEEDEWRLGFIATIGAITLGSCLCCICCAIFAVCGLKCYQERFAMEEV